MMFLGIPAAFLNVLTGRNLGKRGLFDHRMSTPRRVRSTPKTPRYSPMDKTEKGRIQGAPESADPLRIKPVITAAKKALINKTEMENHRISSEEMPCFVVELKRLTSALTPLSWP